MNRSNFNYRGWLAFAHDVAATVIAWYASYWLRFNMDIPEDRAANMWWLLVWVSPLQAIIFWWFNLYRGIWRYASLSDLKRIIKAVGLAGLLVPFAIDLLQPPLAIPRAILLLDPLLLLAIMCGSRIGYRAWKEQDSADPKDLAAEPVLVLGAGDAAAILLREIAKGNTWRVVGLLDDDARKQHRQLHGVTVLGRIGEIDKIATATSVKKVIIALPGAAASVRQRAAKLATQAGLTVLTVPSYPDLLTGKVTVSQVRKIQLEDLLGREQVTLDDAGLHALLTGKCIMVTGAGGSIGSEICRQIARFEPKLLLMYERNEYALYTLEQEFARLIPGTPIACVIGDTKNPERLASIFAQYRPAVVFHAAAYKHVPLMEERNAWEAVQNNVLGTIRTAQAALEHGTEKFVLISTDKAVNPTNVMGASKRLGELACQSMQRAEGTRFVTVRFGNVIGSTGSVVPKFREQIALGGPLTVTHPEITRYFMSIPEAAQLVLQAGLMGKGGEIFVLDMGEPMKIVDLARSMITLSGFTPEEIAIEFTGLRPGEKLYEEVLADSETTLPTPHPKLRVANSNGKHDARWLEELCVWLQQPDPGDAQAREMLAARIPEYSPQEPTRR